MRNKHEAHWKSRIECIAEDLEAAKLTIHNLMQENLALKVQSQQNNEESQRMIDETKVKLEATIDRLKGINFP